MFPFANSYLVTWNDFPAFFNERSYTNRGKQAKRVDSSNGKENASHMLVKRMGSAMRRKSQERNVEMASPSSHGSMKRHMRSQINMHINQPRPGF